MFTVIQDRQVQPFYQVLHKFKHLLLRHLRQRPMVNNIVRRCHRFRYQPSRQASSTFFASEGCRMSVDITASEQFSRFVRYTTGRCWRARSPFQLIATFPFSAWRSTLRSERRQTLSRIAILIATVKFCTRICSIHTVQDWHTHIRINVFPTTATARSSSTARCSFRATRSTKSASSTTRSDSIKSTPFTRRSEPRTLHSRSIQEAQPTQHAKD